MDIKELLAEIADASQSRRAQGECFERIAQAYLRHDPMQKRHYEDVWSYSDWAKQHGISRRDLGIDLVAKLRERDGFTAIQCKFYGEDKRIAKADIDSFISASGKKPFEQRIIIDSTVSPWSNNAEEMIAEQNIETFRIGLHDLVQSPIQWWDFLKDGEIKLAEKKCPRDDQRDAIAKVCDGLSKADRGKLIMACGTGKTFVSLKIAEKMAGSGGMVLFLVPSLSLIAQTIREWSMDAELDLYSIAVCSDSQVGKRGGGGDDIAEIEVTDLAFPASTNALKLSEGVAAAPHSAFRVIFATYQSIEVISEAQQTYGLSEFDLIICDEAHRTTGAKIDNEEESNFIRVHDNGHIQGQKRLYMTATPRIFGAGAKKKAEEHSIELCSMDDPKHFGEVLFYFSFSQAVNQGLLSDFKVIVLTVDESEISHAVQNLLSDENNELQLDDATKIVGCYKALRKFDLNDPVDPEVPMRRALAFCGNIKKSKAVTREFSKVVEKYLASDLASEQIKASPLHCSVQHVDGTFRAKERTKLLNWLKGNSKDNSKDNECCILSNARCLSEGVDVPALDAIIFMHPRKSHIDVVQSVGRVMRKSPGKKLGYVILPIAIPSDMKPEEAMRDNEKFRVVWQILNALRAHDERVDIAINQASLGQDISNLIEIIYGGELESVTAVVGSLPEQNKQNPNPDIGGSVPPDVPANPGDMPQPILFVDEFSRAIMAQIVKKCGARDYWEDWAKDIQKIAESHMQRLRAALNDPIGEARREFDQFANELRDDLNDSISEEDVIEMLSQHLITCPVFETLFRDNKFVERNQVSVAMQRMLDVLAASNLEKETEALEKFYNSVKRRAFGITDPQAKQKLIVQLYDKFFRGAFPGITERLGIVYTPVEVVDFIIRSVSDILQQEFHQSMGDENIHIIDPFTGTGTFITRLMQLGLMTPDQLERKYRREIHANEIVLLAYYIAAINIETVFHSLREGDYVPFQGLCLTDTFQMYESETLASHWMPDNSARRSRQKALDIRVIIANPPYSAGQKSQNDNRANIKYESLDNLIGRTYAGHSQAQLQRYLYDSYIRAICWGSDRLGEAGIMAYVSGSGWIERSFANRMRKCLAEKYSNIYVFHLRGDIRKNMLNEGKAGEGENIFGQNNRTGTAISIFVKNPHATEHGKIFFHDIGDSLDRQEKFNIIKNFASITGITDAKGWQNVIPDRHNDWLNQCDSSFDVFISLGDKDAKQAKTIFANYSLGIATNRDAWCYNSSARIVQHNMSRTIEFFNSEVNRLTQAGLSRKAGEEVRRDTTQISWTRALLKDAEKQKTAIFNKQDIVTSLYRPFTKQWIYFNRRFNESINQMPKIFPNAKAQNRLIVVTGVGSRNSFSCLVADTVVDLNLMEAGVQCFPLKFYEPKSRAGRDMSSMLAADDLAESYIIKDGITDEGLLHFQTAYPDETLSKDDIFYYIYGLLHLDAYRGQYANNLVKELPRIPCIKTAEAFWQLSKAGRELAELHLNYEQLALYPVTFSKGNPATTQIDNPEEFYRVHKMCFGKPGKDKSTIIYNDNITITDIPLEIYNYQISGRSALRWVMDRQRVKIEKKSGITNDANRYAIETVGNPAYPLELLQRIITMSLETIKIVNNLPDFEIAP